MPDAALTQPPPLPDAPAPAPPPAPPPPAPCRPGPPPAGAPPGAAAGGVCRHGGAGPRKFSGGCLLAAAPVLRTPAKPFLEDLASAVAAASLAARRGRRVCRTLRLVAGKGAWPVGCVGELRAGGQPGHQHPHCAGQRLCAPAGGVSAARRRRPQWG